MATQRGYYRAELMRAIDAIVKCHTHLDRVVQAYAKDHPEVSGKVKEVDDALLLITEIIQSVHDAI